MMEQHYLSEAIVPIADAFKKHISDSYRWHQQIWLAFPNQPEAKREFLFRVDARDGGYRILLLSTKSPQDSDIMKWRTTEVTDAFLSHKRYKFQLKANPTFRRSSDKRRIAIYDEEGLTNWIVKKASDAGFKIIPGSLRFTGSQSSVFRNGDNKIGKHSSVDYTGEIEVMDFDLFKKNFFCGIGPAKGFGYGLLMLQPITINN